MRYLLFCFLSFLLINCQGQTKVDYLKLTKELDSMMIEDQKFRNELSSFSSQSVQDSIKWESMVVSQNKIDSLNLLRIQEIIEEVGGYPGKSMVGESASKAAFFVLQHSTLEVQKEHLDLILQAAENYELNKSYAAMFHDRVLMREGKPQIYGTQIRVERVFDSITGNWIGKRYLWPIQDTTNVDSLRLWHGLGSLEAYLYEAGVELKE